MRQINSTGIRMLKEFEGLSLTAYPDIVKVWTIGYGHTRGAFKGQVITLEQAQILLDKDLRVFETGVEKLVKVPLSDNEFSALVLLTFNIGLGHFGSSTLLRKLNEGDKLGAAAEFMRWNHAGGRVIEGLTKRRELERALFMTAAPQSPPPFTPTTPTIGAAA